MNVAHTPISHQELWKSESTTLGDSLELALELVTQELGCSQVMGQADAGLFGGKPYNLGYYAGGMLMLPFVQWIIEVAREMGLQDLYFLSRDGHIIKRVYELLAPYYDGAPKAHYLLASRRAFNNASLHSNEDILESLVGSFLTGSPKSILESRFGVVWGAEQDNACVDAGFSNGEILCDFELAQERKKLSDFLLSQCDAILSQARTERSALCAYLKEACPVGNKSAVVDIGHSASLQKSLQRLLDDQNIAGLYFMTFEKAREAHSAQAPVRGWFGEFVDPDHECREYCENIGMFEFLFLNDEDSLSHFEMINDEAPTTPVYVDEPPSDRKALAAKVHDGIEKFTKDVIEALGDRVVEFSLQRDEATRAMIEFVCRPSQVDARMVSNVLFFDGYAGEATHYMVAQCGSDAIKNLMSLGEYLEKSWWKPGAWALVAKDDASLARAKWLYWLWSGPVGRVARRLRKIRGPL